MARQGTDGTDLAKWLSTKDHIFPLDARSWTATLGDLLVNAEEAADAEAARNEFLVRSKQAELFRERKSPASWLSRFRCERP